jgi:hypothetical protein
MKGSEDEGQREGMVTSRTRQAWCLNKSNVNLDSIHVVKRLAITDRKVRRHDSDLAMDANGSILARRQTRIEEIDLVVTSNSIGEDWLVCDIFVTTRFSICTFIK